MTEDFLSRLDKILPRVTSDSFLANQGLGNEIPYYAFDYPPEREGEVREHIRFLLEQIPKKRPEINLKHVDLLELTTNLLKARGFEDKVIEMQRQKGNDAVKTAIKGPLKAENIAKALKAYIGDETTDLVLISGVGSAYPMIRLHNLLNNLHPLMDETPLVFFYPGIYDGQSLRLFGILDDKPYYRAFRLVD